eukprot:TRINITY_DN13005_c0_g1_i1.p1 TRINITY_DN13005_c0_g1~~TRINITY_DN13005_c0_g1_i1.p1  ORF type:complete len:461 (+),score=112.03 TRINITY_DN13005_c0_g1_i1:51-1433(+)
MNREPKLQSYNELVSELLDFERTPGIDLTLPALPSPVQMASPTQFAQKSRKKKISKVKIATPVLGTSHPPAPSTPKPATSSPRVSDGEKAINWKKQYDSLSTLHRKAQKELTILHFKAAQVDVYEKEAEHLRIELKTKSSDVKILRSELVNVCKQMDYMANVMQDQELAMSGLQMQASDAVNEKQTVVDEIDLLKEELATERQNAELVITKLQYNAVRGRKPGIAVGCQTETVVDDAVYLMRTQVAEHEQNIRSLKLQLQNKNVELHQKDQAEKKLKSFAQHLQKTAMEKTQLIETQTRELATLRHQVEAFDREKAEAAKEVLRLRYLLDQRATRTEILTPSDREVLSLLQRVQAAESAAAGALEQQAQLRSHEAQLRAANDTIEFLRVQLAKAEANAALLSQSDLVEPSDLSNDSITVDDTQTDIVGAVSAISEASQVSAALAAGGSTDPDVSVVEQPQ